MSIGLCWFVAIIFSFFMRLMTLLCIKILVKEKRKSNFIKCLFLAHTTWCEHTLTLFIHQVNFKIALNFFLFIQCFSKSIVLYSFYFFFYAWRIVGTFSMLHRIVACPLDLMRSCFSRLWSLYLSSLGIIDIINRLMQIWFFAEHISFLESFWMRLKYRSDLQNEFYFIFMI